MTEGKTRLHLDFNSPQQAAAFGSWLRGMEKLPGDEVDIVQMTDGDSAEACGVVHQFLVVPRRRDEHGPSIYELVETPVPDPEAVPEMPEPAHGLKAPTSASPF